MEAVGWRRRWRSQHTARLASATPWVRRLTRSRPTGREQDGHDGGQHRGEDGFQHHGEQHHTEQRDASPATSWSPALGGGAGDVILGEAGSEPDSPANVIMPFAATVAPTSKSSRSRRAWWPSSGCRCRAGRDGSQYLDLTSAASRGYSVGMEPSSRRPPRSKASTTTRRTGSASAGRSARGLAWSSNAAIARGTFEGGKVSAIHDGFDDVR